jgi:hypothetical protein
MARCSFESGRHFHMNQCLLPKPPIIHRLGFPLVAGLGQPRPAPYTDLMIDSLHSHKSFSQATSCASFRDDRRGRRLVPHKKRTRVHHAQGLPFMLSSFLYHYTLDLMIMRRRNLVRRQRCNPPLPAVPLSCGTPSRKEV